MYGSECVGGTWEEEADYVQIEVQVRQISERAKVRWQRYMVGYVYAESMESRIRRRYVQRERGEGNSGGKSVADQRASVSICVSSPSGKVE